MTTRNLCGPTLLVLGLAALLTGCSTPGPNHAYVASTGDAAILDLMAGAPAVEVSSHLVPVDEIYGIAYDPFTDHLFLRIIPGNFIRVVDRPARAIKRDFEVEGLPEGPGDLAIRSSDRHLFFAHPTEPVLVESTLFGKHVRTIRLEHLQGPPAGVAYDQKRDLLLILAGGNPAQVVTYSLAGSRLGAVPLDHRVLPTSLAFDSVARELYAPLNGEGGIGVFDGNGHLLRKLPVPTAQNYAHVDVGARSLLRLF
ncbi:MAG: hypothetical protein JF599_03980 [Verrucomicrobia bacterium]|nr:hypothetical protein [Verrucomicrobiota bacterium]